MQHPIVLSDRAWAFVEARRGEVPADSYVSKLLENIAWLSSEGIVTLDGMHVIDEIEACVPPVQKAAPPEEAESDAEQRRQIARRTIDYLRDAYHNQVPRRVFERKCKERGLTTLDILDAEEEYKQWIS